MRHGKKTNKKTTMRWLKKKKSEMHFYKAGKLYTMKLGAQSSAFVFLRHDRSLERKFAFYELTLSEPHAKSYRLYEALPMHVADLVVRPWGRLPLKERRKRERKQRCSPDGPCYPFMFSFPPVRVVPKWRRTFPTCRFSLPVQFTHIAPRLCVSSGQS